MNYLAAVIWNIFLVSGAAYLIGWKSWNPWWMLLALLLLWMPKG